MEVIRHSIGREYTRLKLQTEWLAIRTCTDPADRGRSEEAASQIYKMINADQPRFVWEASPCAVLDALNRLDPKVLFWEKELAVRWTQLRDALWWASSRFIDERFTNRWAHLLGDPLREQVEVALELSFRRSRLYANKYPLWGFEEGLEQLHLFCRDAFGAVHDERASEYLELTVAIAESCYWWWPLQGVCFFSDRPPFVKTEESYEGIRLHYDYGPAMQFPDDWSIYALHGIQVPPEVIEDPPDQLDPRILLKIPNAEIRQGVVQKIGIERIFRKIEPRVMDSHGNYTLVALDLGDSQEKPYLRMLNPSTGQWHIEGVHPQCKTVKQALAWRNGTHVQPLILT